MIAVRALAAFWASPLENIYCNPPMIITITAATPAINAITKDTFFRIPFGPAIGFVVPLG
jgi:hypothetical protein